LGTGLGIQGGWNIVQFSAIDKYEKEDGAEGQDKGHFLLFRAGSLLWKGRFADREPVWIQQQLFPDELQQYLERVSKQSVSLDCPDRITKRLFLQSEGIRGVPGVMVIVHFLIVTSFKGLAIMDSDNQIKPKMNFWGVFGS
jgi:hypothetical protein